MTQKAVLSLRAWGQVFNIYIYNISTKWYKNQNILKKLSLSHPCPVTHCRHFLPYGYWFLVYLSRGTLFLTKLLCVSLPPLFIYLFDFISLPSFLPSFLINETYYIFRCLVFFNLTKSVHSLRPLLNLDFFCPLSVLQTFMLCHPFC